MRRTAACFLFVLFGLSPFPLLSQDAGPLAVGDERRITLAPGDSSEFTIELQTDQFVYGEVDQQDGDVRLSLLGPENEILATFDALDRGPEPFVLSSETSGTFRMRVESTEEEATVRPRVRLLTVEPVAADPSDRLDQLMRPYSGTDRPGVVVGIVKDGALRLSRAYGMANLEHGVPFRPATISNIGSVSKQFTAMALLLLEQDGKLSLDDDVRDHLPELPDLGDPVTLRNLLNHTGGYREIYNLLPLTGYRGEDGFDRSRAIQVVQRQTERQAPPNTEYNYNNTGFILLSYVVERVSGESFDAFMRARVFQPLGMSDTRVKMIQGQVIPGSAQGYVPEEGRGYRTARDLAASAGAGGIYTTVSDLARWLGNYAEPELGGAEGVRQLTTSAVLANGDTTGYGLGLGVSTRRGRRLYAHTGGDVAHRAYLGYYPEFDGGVIIMSNNALFDLGVGTRLGDVFFSAELEPIAEKVAEGGSVEVAAARLEALAGEWVVEAGPKVTFGVADGSLTIEVEGQARLTMVATTDSTFAVPSVEATITFHTASDGSVDEATLSQAGETRLSRIDAGVPTALELAAFEGRYFSPELEVYYVVEAGDGVLSVRQLNMPPIELSPRGDDEFAGSAFFLATVSFERDGSGDVVGFTVNNVRTKGVRFRKES